MFNDASQVNSHTNSSASRCPFCQNLNRCLMASASSAAEKNLSDSNQLQCWCMTVEIPKELQELAHARGLDDRCICRGCVEEYGRDREGFLLRYQ